MSITFPEIIERIHEKLHTAKATAPFFPDKRYQPIQFEKGNFAEINIPVITEKKSGHAQKTCVFIDGGNTEIIGNAGFCYHFIRTYAATYTGTSRIHRTWQEYTCLVTTNVHEKKHVIEIYENSHRNNSRNNRTEKDNMQKLYEHHIENEHDTSPEIAAGYARRLLEIYTAQCAVEQVPNGSIIVLDGNLCAKNKGEHEMIAQLLNTAHAKEINIAGVVKSSAVLTDAGTSLVGHIHNMSAEQGMEQKRWFYEPVCINSNPWHNTDIIIAHLHPRSAYTFMIDIARGSNRNAVLHILAEHSRDPTFLGYPYGLIDADKNARCTQREQSIMQARMHILHKEPRMRRMLSTIEAHSVLDNMEY